MLNDAVEHLTDNGGLVGALHLSHGVVLYKAELAAVAGDLVFNSDESSSQKTFPKSTSQKCLQLMRCDPLTVKNAVFLQQRAVYNWKKKIKCHKAECVTAGLNDVKIAFYCIKYILVFHGVKRRPSFGMCAVT